MGKHFTTAEKFVNVADGGANAKTLPPNRILIYDKAKDEFVEDTNPSQVQANLKTLLLIHGALAISTNYVRGWEKKDDVALRKGSFAELLERPRDGSDTSFLHKWVSSGKYQQVIAYDHPTIKKTIEQNCEDFIHLLPGEEFCFEYDVDFIAGSRGGIIGKYLANNFDKSSSINPKVPIGNAAFISCSNGSHILHFHHITGSQANTKKNYLKALRTIIDALSIPKGAKKFLKSNLDKLINKAVEVLESPGIQSLNPNSKELELILAGVPASPYTKGTKDAAPTQYLPIIGKYDGTDEDKQILKQDIELIAGMAKRQLKKMIQGGILNFLVLQYTLLRLKPKKNVRKILLEDEKVIRKIFKGHISDGVNRGAFQHIMPAGHYADCYEKKTPVRLSTTALHSFYLDKAYLNKGMSIMEIIQVFLDDPTTACSLIQQPNTITFHNTPSS